MRTFTIMALIQQFMRDRRGNVAMMLALFLLPLVFFSGAAVDYARAVQFRTVLQGATDAAALAGAIEYVNSSDGSTAVAVATNYMNSIIKTLPASDSGSFTITPGTTSSNGHTYATVAVTVTAQVPTTLMALVENSMPVSTSATAAEECGSSGCGSVAGSSTTSFGSSSSGSSGSGSSGSGSGSSGSSGSGSGSSGSSGSGSSGYGSSGSGSSGFGSSGSGSSGSGSSGDSSGSGSSGSGSSGSGSSGYGSSGSGGSGSGGRGSGGSGSGGSGSGSSGSGSSGSGGSGSGSSGSGRQQFQQWVGHSYELAGHVPRPERAVGNIAI